MSADASGSAAILERTDRYIAQTYARSRVAFVRGRGAELWDADGKRYLDFFSSILCTNLGHAHPAVTRAICEQADRLVHLSNLHYSEPQSRLAEKLVEHSFAERVFLCNSGTEANEAALKAARRYGHARGGRYEVLTTLGSFHGRTMAMIAATGQEKVRRGFEPMLPGFRYVPYGDVAAMEEAIRPETVAILVEPIQGEGGVVVPPDRYLPGLRELCDRHDMLLMFDEVQTGCGRTGQWFGYQHFGVTPDVMTLSKAICGGLAGAAMLARPEIAPSLRPGMHACTFGGNPIAAAAGLAAIEMIEKQNLLENTQRIGRLFRQRLDEIKTQCEIIRDVRVAGVMIGIELAIDGAPIVRACMERRLLVNCTHGTVIRLLPAMTLSEEQLQQGCDILAEAIKSQAG